MRIGHGFDAHRFSESGELILGGVTIDEAPKLEAHSDGDVLIHAVCDALLGALGMGDIGMHFPDTDDEWENVDSRKLLRHVVSLMAKEGYCVGNCDVSIIAQKPRLANHLPAMKELLSLDMEINQSQLNIKATTTEKMGYIGRAEGIAVHSVVFIVAA